VEVVGAGEAGKLTPQSVETSIIIEDYAMSINLPPVHPGEILREDYLGPLGMSAGALARSLNVPRTRIERLVAEDAPVTIDTALRLARFFNTTPEFWMNMQTGYELKRQAEEKKSEIAAIQVLPVA
jgi:addiction module HigA family antidote